VLITAKVRNLDGHRLHLLDDSPIVSPAGLDRFEHGLGAAALVEASLRLLCETFAVSLPVVDNRDWFVAPAFGEKIAGDPALKVVPANHAEDVDEALFRQLRIGRFS
jgi:hypothetical protein